MTSAERTEAAYQRPLHAASDVPLPEFLPDALVDSTRRRKTKAGRRLGGGAGLLPRLLSVSGHDLRWAVISLGEGDLYSREVNQHARDITRDILGDVPGWNVLERGAKGGLHVNVLAPAAADLTFPARTWHRPISADDVPVIACYLSKPADGRVCNLRDPRTGIRHAPTPDGTRAALDDYERAKKAARAEGKQLPRLSWTYNLPRMKPHDLDVMTDLVESPTTLAVTPAGIVIPNALPLALLGHPAAFAEVVTLPR